MDEQHVDLSKLGCRVIDVHNAIQSALYDFSSGDDTSLEGLVNLIQNKLGEVPVFVVEMDPSRE